MSDREFNVRVHEEEDHVWGEVEELPGCFATGDTLDELMVALEESINLYLNDAPRGGSIVGRRKKKSAPHMALDNLRVKVPA